MVRRNVRHRRRGFTLVELLVGIVVMSMLALLSWRSIDGMTRTQALTQERADALLRMQAALGQWHADLDAVMDTGELAAVDFDGRVLRLTRRDAGESGLNSAGLRVVAWSLIADGSGGRQWARWQSDTVQRRDQLASAWQRASEWGRESQGRQTGPGRDSSVLLFPASAWQLFYHRGETWANPQSSIGAANGGAFTFGENTVPDGVRLVLTLPEGAGLSGDLRRDWVRPTLEAGR
ncbi:MAG: prepilin-type N-terminal cleavage/methylation domain-containing protein [Hydrogenophaga sp.]|jgi:general secretion pathway protein J|nr:prepilin-type N-terminal cleavage/methylation domain-containing protein [Hydrogenophaga sp.]